MSSKTLEITLVLVSDNTFNVEVYEPESGDLKIIKCHDSGELNEVENKKITDEFRSWVSIMREDQND